jgi:hypothetical protein
MSMPTSPDFSPTAGMVVVAVVETDETWSVRCPSCWTPSRYAPAVGFREARWCCDGWPYDGFVVAPPGARLAPYLDMCRECRREAASPPWPPTNLREAQDGTLTAAYACNMGHAWEARWADLAEPFRPTFPPGERTALYRHYDHAGVLLYVGISNDLVARGKNHVRRSEWAGLVARTEAVWYLSRAEAEYEERRAIQIEVPTFNVAHALIPFEYRFGKHFGPYFESIAGF